MRHTSDGTAIDHVAVAILRDGDGVVLVQQHYLRGDVPAGAKTHTFVGIPAIDGSARIAAHAL